jgi:hypothetical protein
VQVMTPPFASVAIDVEARRRKHPLPRPFEWRVRVLASRCACRVPPVAKEPRTRTLGGHDHADGHDQASRTHDRYSVKKDVGGQPVVVERPPLRTARARSDIV